MSKVNRQKRLLQRAHLPDWRFVKDSVVVGASSTIARVLGLLFSTLLARFLTPDDFGFFRYSLTLISIIIIVVTTSPVSLARFLATSANDSHKRDCYFTNGLVGVALLLFLSLLISVPILWQLHTLNLGAIVCILGMTIFFSYFAIVRGLSSAWKMGLTYILTNVALNIALFVVLGVFGLRTAIAALMIYGLANLIPPLILEPIKPMTPRFRPGLISKTVLLELARFSVPMVVSSGAYTVWTAMDLLLVQSFNPHASGSYAVAETLSQAFIFVPTGITMVLMPLAAAQPEKSRRYCIGGALVAFLISLIGLAIVYIKGQKLVALIFGNHYNDAYLPLVVISVGMSIYSVYIVLEGFVIGRGRPNLSAQALLVALVATASIGLWLTPRLGMLGASLAFTIGVVLCSMILLFNTWRFLRTSKGVASSKFSSTNQPLSTTKHLLATESGELIEGEPG